MMMMMMIMIMTMMIMMMIVMMMMMIMMIMMMITTTSPSHRSQAPCSGQISSEGGFLLLALDLKLFLLSVWFLPYQLDEIKTYPTLQEVLVLVRLMVMGSTNHLLLSFFFSLCFLYFCAFVFLCNPPCSSRVGMRTTCEG